MDGYKVNVINAKGGVEELVFLGEISEDTFSALKEGTLKTNGMAGYIKRDIGWVLFAHPVTGFELKICPRWMGVRKIIRHFSIIS